MLLNPGIFGCLAWEFLGKSVEVGLLEEGLVFLHLDRRVVLGSAQRTKVDGVASLRHATSGVVLVEAGVDTEVTSGACSTGLGGFPYSKRFHLLPIETDLRLSIQFNDNPSCALFTLPSLAFLGYRSTSVRTRL